jgi:MAF protein
MARLGIPFEAYAPACDERPLPGEPAPELVVRLAKAKAWSVVEHNPKALIVGSDQVAVMDNEILGKPEDQEAAVGQLSRASGRRVDFHTGLCLLNAGTGNCQREDVEFTVYFRQLTRQQIHRYLDREKPYDCAGSFKSEGLGITLFERMAGDDPTALVGLPLIRLTTMLLREGIVLPLARR